MILFPAITSFGVCRLPFISYFHIIIVSTIQIRFRLVLLAVAYLFYAMTAFGQKLPFTNYNTANGLSHNRTHTIKQDGKGFIWIGTDMGINRYDGRTFKHYPCPGNPYVAARFTTRYADSVIFSVDYYGIAICYGDSVRFIKLNTRNTGLVGGVVPTGNNSFYTVDEPHGLYRFKEGKQEQIVLPKPIVNEWNFSDLYKDRAGSIWLLSASGLIFFRHGDMTRPLLIPFFGKNYINVVRQDRDGNIYVASHAGVFRYREAQCDDIAAAKPELILPPIAEISGITFDRHNNVWMSSSFKGLLEFDVLTRSVKNYGVESGLVSQNTWDAFCDNEDNVWVASENGVSKLSTKNYSWYDLTQTNYQNVKSTCIWNDSTLLFSNLIDLYSLTNGISKKVTGYTNLPGFLEEVLAKTPDNRLLVNINDPSPMGAFVVHTTICDFKNNALINCRKLKELPGAVGLVYTNRGMVYRNNELWMTGPSGICCYQNGGFLPVKQPENGISPTFIDKAADGTLWAIDRYRNLVHLAATAGGTSTYSYTLTQKEYIRQQDIGDQYYAKLFVDSKGRIWLCGRQKGMCLLFTGKDGNVAKIRLLDINTFSSGLITDITEDDEHNIWVGTAAGLDKVTFHGDSFIVQKDVYGSQLCGKYIFVIRKFANKLYIGTSGCMGVINVTDDDPKVPPYVYISGLKINEKDQTRLLLANPVLQPGENSIDFTFLGLSFKDEHRIRYSYKLEGLDENWSTPRPEYSITYSLVPPGTYTFRVKALSATGLWSVQPASYTFTIAQPFYTRWWFITLVAVAILGITYSVYRYRINQILQIQRIRQTISKDLHDDIGATVSSINILANMAKSDLVSDGKRNQFLETIQEESKHVSESLNDIVWSINPKNDSIEIIIARMQRYASELFEAQNISYEIELPDAPPSELSLQMATRQQVYLIFKEAVNNLAKYAGTTKARIALVVTKNEFSITITDNGKGFDTAQTNTGNGIFNMKKRAQDINASLAIISAPGEGTTVTLSIPL